MTRLEVHPDVSVHQIGTPSLGDHTYVIAVGDSAAIIDPQRDYERFLTAMGSAEPVAVLETHIHNDYVTGGALLAAEYGCAYLLPVDSDAELKHTPIGDGGTVPITEGWALRAIHTPGHTAHHTSYALTSPDGDVVVFTGGSMLVGAVGRTDLVDRSQTEGLTRHQFRSVRRLSEVLEAPVVVAPTHGAGSFCASGPTSGTASTIGAERLQNPALIEDDEDRFVRTQTAGLGLYPAYYRHMAPLNRSGVEPVPGPVPELRPDDLRDSTATIVDIRPAPVALGGRIPGSLAVPYSATAAAYLGWVRPWNEPVVLVADSPSIAEAMRLDLARIGWDAVSGVVTDGLAAWMESGGEIHESRSASFAALPDGASVLDVRDPIEASDIVTGATAVHLSTLDPASLGEGPHYVHCASGYRAVVAASMLEAAGVAAVAITEPYSEYRGERTPV